jgi:sterol 14-demethylase
MQVKEPPIVGGRLPLLGHMIAFGKNPFQFMMKARREYGEIVEFRMFHQRMILLTGEDASAFFYRGTDDEFDQSAAYKLMTPIFGEGVVFDAPQEKKDQQLKMLMPALRDRPMRTYSGTTASARSPTFTRTCRFRPFASATAPAGVCSSW